MEKCNALSQKDNNDARKEYKPIKCVMRLIAIDVITASDGNGQAAYTWDGNGWSEALGQIFG